MKSRFWMHRSVTQLATLQQQAMTLTKLHLNAAKHQQEGQRQLPELSKEQPCRHWQKLAVPAVLAALGA
jgi:hypothetical protein